MRQIDRLIIHCSDSDIPGQTAAMISSWHVAQGWSTIGYNYLIQNNGKLERGRGLEDVGAHCKGYNHDSLGICLAGKTFFSAAQFDTLKMLLEILVRVCPDAELKPHAHYNKNKTCPVFNTRPFEEFWLALPR